MRRLFCFSLLLLVIALPAFATESPPQLTVHGQALLEVPADQARVNLAVVTTAASAQDALQQNSTTLKAVTAALIKAGLKPGEFRTGRFEIRPEWTLRPPKPAPGWRPSISGYTVRNSLHLTTKNLPSLGSFIEAGTKAGANSVEGLQFDLADPGAFQKQAIAQATANARREARALARAAGVRLGNILSLRLGPPVARPQLRVAAFAQAAPVPLTPGTVPVRAEVTMVYRIEQP